MKTLLLAIVLSMAIVTTAFSTDTSRLRSAQHMLDAAKSQSDLNHASKAFFLSWKEDLEKKQKEVEGMLPKNSVKDFRSSMELWKKHVHKMSIVRSNLFKKSVTDPLYLSTRGIKNFDQCKDCVKDMTVYIYNMSMAIYYEQKWLELNILTNDEL